MKHFFNKSTFLLLIIASISITIANRKTVRTSIISQIYYLQSNLKNDIESIDFSKDKRDKTQIKQIRLTNGQIIEGRELNKLLSKDPRVVRNEPPTP